MLRNVEATRRPDASRDLLFDVLTDYDRYREWLPGIEHSRVLARARELMARPRPEAAVEGESLLQIYETADGIEVWFAGRTYILKAAD